MLRMNPRWDESIGTILVHLVWKNKSCGICRDGTYGPSFRWISVGKAIAPNSCASDLQISGDRGKEGPSQQREDYGGLLEKIHSRSETILANMGL